MYSEHLSSMASTDSKSYTAISLWEKSVLNLFSGLRLSKKLNANCWFQAESVIENGTLQ